jgi:hypothetical protein
MSFSLAGTSSNRWPQALQNLLPCLLDFPHSGHSSSNLWPQALQNLALSSFSNWHFGQFTCDLLQEKRCLSCVREKELYAGVKTFRFVYFEIEQRIDLFDFIFF